MFLLALPDLVLSPQVVTAQQSVPGFEPIFPRYLDCERIDAYPSFSGRLAVQILVWPDVVVEEAEFSKRSVEPRERLDSELIQFPFQCPEEALHPAVLPGAMEVDSLMTDGKEEEGETERLRGEDRFVVRSGDARLAVAPVGLDELWINAQLDLLCGASSQSAARLACSKMARTQ